MAQLLVTIAPRELHIIEQTMNSVLVQRSNMSSESILAIRTISKFKCSTERQIKVSKLEAVFAEVASLIHLPMLCSKIAHLQRAEPI